VEGLNIGIGLGFNTGLLIENAQGPCIADGLSVQVGSVRWPDGKEETLENVPKIFIVKLSTLVGFGNQVIWALLVGCKA